MGTFFRAAIGLSIALTVLHGPAIWSGVKTSSLQKVEADIGDARPGARLEASLVKFLVPQNSTTQRN